MRRFVPVLLSVLCLGPLLRADDASAPRLIFPLGRVAYQTNEMIDLSIVRASGATKNTTDLKVSLTSDDGSQIDLVFPGKSNDAVEHLQLNGHLLRPAKYSVKASIDGQQATASFEVYSHIRRSTFKTIDWGSRAKDKEQRDLGEDGLGFNLLYYNWGGLNPDETIRGGMDYMRNCTMSGGHQLDLRQECDWSDPYALQGADARVAREALEDRTRPNCIGVHFYDEPGLTWAKHPKTGIATPYNVPAQDRSYRAAFGVEAPQYNDIKPNDSAAIERWMQYSIWRLSLMEAAWNNAKLAVNEVRPDYLTATQSMYAFPAYGDGYYFNVVRPLSVISGHGGYDDGASGYFYPPFHLEFGRMRDGIGANKPVWYLPSWYRLTPETYRVEQYLSFMSHVQGLAKPPDLLAHDPSQTPEEAAIVEANKLAARLGTIFTTMPLTRSPVAQLYSISQDLSAEVRDMQDPKTIEQSAYMGGGHSRAKSLSTYLAGKLLHIPFTPIVEEDILDGTLASHHRAVILPGIDHLEPNVIAALEQFIAGGGAVFVSDDSRVEIKGATKIGAPASTAQWDLTEKLWHENKRDEGLKQHGAFYFFKDAEPMANALRPKLAALGIRPAMDSDQRFVVTARQALGDVEYLFATNATPDEQAKSGLALKPVVATLGVINDGRAIYDAIRGKVASEFAVKDQVLSASLRFGPGQMRVFARTARPIGAVQITSPIITCDYTQIENPLRVEFSAAVTDSAGKVLCGSIPLQIKVVDPLGVARFDIDRATEKGICRIDLPLAANDPAGKWTVSVRELLNDAEGATTFEHSAPAQVGAIAGVTQRALVFGNDRDNIFRFFHTFEELSIVAGKGDYTAAVERIVTSLRPWDVKCKVVSVDEASKPRALTSEESSTWVGLVGGVTKDQKTAPSPEQVGFNIQGPVILLGTPQDNPLIQFALQHKFLPYAPDAKAFPGPSRGIVAWQRDCVGYQQQSITLIGYDAAGISEAIGTMYQSLAGQEPLMPLAPPMEAHIAPAMRSNALPEAKVIWRAALPDRVVSLNAEGDHLVAISFDGSHFTIDAAGHVGSREDARDVHIDSKNAPPKLSEAVAKSLPPGLIAKLAAEHGSTTAVGFWGGTVEGLDAAGKPLFKHALPQDVCAMAWMGDLLVVGMADGEIVALKP